MPKGKGRTPPEKPQKIDFSLGNMEASIIAKEWCLRLEGASGSPPTEHSIEVGKNTDGSSGLRITNAFFKPTASNYTGIPIYV